MKRDLRALQEIPVTEIERLINLGARNRIGDANRHYEAQFGILVDIL
ncbi:hypothetical protein RFM41_06685 [Mesorhizobium sp. VK25A]|uniref:Uncharacterized protein n=1 Tax=Mesorhizobium vachelliae TaxID=3072309 RepID=A0ABU5A3Q9_9HYPH|nr:MULTISPECIES: hypothetical protein [unclassified Mesorhizobium]MDX8530831.1 hypothetical protein [Mesorhizobium sp. VK25D]MDX8543418.1 hypothetical protein [Mesorhizobium sp. VK25A]